MTGICVACLLVTRQVRIEDSLPDGCVEVRFQAAASISGPGARKRGSFEQGTLIETGKPFDLAIDGAGYIQITRPTGELGGVAGM